ncbi:hypothetical protein GJAV_G00138110 [Gymnothorax javanicus]|nr:hypothetical protein GJAV_G00138110 [Gymnothorax javanicus]
MGNNFNKAVDKWGLNPRKFPRKSKKEKDVPAYPTYPVRHISLCSLASLTWYFYIHAVHKAESRAKPLVTQKRVLHR